MILVIINTWYDRNALEITKYLKESQVIRIMVIKGIGTYVYDRDINNLVKRVAILENSCRLLSLKSTLTNNKNINFQIIIYPLSYEVILAILKLKYYKVYLNILNLTQGVLL